MNAERAIKLVIMIPALNEARAIGGVIDAIPREVGAPAEIKVIVIDDGSTDETGQIAREKGAAVLRHSRTMGLGSSFAHGLERALEEGADLVVNIDADGQFDPQDIPKLIQPILEDRADFVTATRFARKDLVPDMPWVKKWGNTQMRRLVNFVTGGTPLSDVSCGFRAYNIQAALNLHLSGSFTHAHETIIDLARKGLRLVEVPLKVRGERAHGESRMAKSVLVYGLRAGGMVLRALCRTRPLIVFGTLGGSITGLGILQGLIVFIHWWRTGLTTPIRSLLIGASLFITVGFLTLVLALVADMLDRGLDLSEKQLYFAKLARYEEIKKRLAKPKA